MEWARFHLAQQTKYKVRYHCGPCEEGEEVQCPWPKEDGEDCPFERLAPELRPENDLVVALFNAAQASAVQVAAEDKTYFYIRPTDLVALMDIQNVPRNERPLMLQRVQMLQTESNRMRPSRPKKVGLPGVGRGR